MASPIDAEFLLAALDRRLLNAIALEHNTQSSCSGVRKLPSDGSSDDVEGQALAISSSATHSYQCYKDINNAVIALHNDELVFVDWKLQRDGIGNNVIRIVTMGNENGRQNFVRSVPFPVDLLDMRVVDMEYVPFRSTYIFASVPRPQKIRGQQKCFLYSFDSTNDKFQERIPFTDSKNGVITRFCCCPDKKVVYLIINVFGESYLTTLDTNDHICDEKAADTLLPHHGRLVDVACTTKNEQLAFTYNTIEKNIQGRIGVCPVDLTTWARIVNIDLGLTSIAYVIPRLIWSNKQNMFILVNYESHRLITFNPEGEIVGSRSFSCFVPEYEANLSPINICTSYNGSWVAVRYARCVNVHRVDD